MVSLDEMDKFIKEYASYYESNPNVSIYPNSIYQLLIQYNLREDEITNNDISDQITDLDKNFSKARNIDVFNSELQPGFLQFRKEKLKLKFNVSEDNKQFFICDAKKYLDKIIKKSNRYCFIEGKDEVIIQLNSLLYLNPVYNYLKSNQYVSSSDVISRESAFIKLYLSTPKEYIGYVSQRVFEYIDKLGINTSSKVASNVRSDGIVIRVENEEDAKKVIDYVNNDKVLSSLLRDTNPFMLKEGLIGVVYDGSLSYNGVISSLLSDYFNELKGNNKLNEASIDDFASFVDKKYNDYFINDSKITELDRYISGSNVGLTIVNYEEVYRLINSLLHNRLSFEELVGLYNETLNYDRHLQLAIIYEQTYNSKKNMKVMSFGETKKLVDEYIKYCLSRDLSIKYIANSLLQIMNGNLGLINYEFKDRFKIISKSELHNILGDDIEQYINMYVDNMVNMFNQIKDEPVVINDMLSKDDTIKVFNTYIEYLFSKNDVEDIIRLLAEYLNGNYSNIDDKFKDLFLKIDKKYLLSIINGSLSNYVKMITNSLSKEEVSNEKKVNI